jgi:hypothetical protein
MLFSGFPTASRWFDDSSMWRTNRLCPNFSHLSLIIMRVYLRIQLPMYEPPVGRDPPDGSGDLWKVNGLPWVPTLNECNHLPVDTCLSARKGCPEFPNACSRVKRSMTEHATPSTCLCQGTSWKAMIHACRLSYVTRCRR